MLYSKNWNASSFYSSFFFENFVHFWQCYIFLILEFFPYFLQSFVPWHIFIIPINLKFYDLYNTVYFMTDNFNHFKLSLYHNLYAIVLFNFLEQIQIAIFYLPVIFSKYFHLFPFFQFLIFRHFINFKISFYYHL